MNITEEIKNLDTSSASSIGMFFFSMLAPGFLVMFIFQRELFISLETIKLIIISLSISSPGVIVPFVSSTITTSVLIHKKAIEPNQLGSRKEWFFKHGFNNALNMYILLFISYIWSWPFSWFAWSFFACVFLSSMYEGWHLIKMAVNPDKYTPMELP